jgi:hypothetical protein
VEVFLETTLGQSADVVTSDGGSTVPLRVLGPGELFGVFETLHHLLREDDSRPQWSVAAGTRSVWIIAPLKDKRISEVLSAQTDHDIDWARGDSHWRLIEQTTTRSDAWNTEILFLSKGLVERVEAHQPGTEQLFELILATGWRQSAALRRATTIDAALRQRYLDGPSQAVSSEFGEMYMFATVSHLFSISRGDAPAYEPAGGARQVHGPFVDFERQLHEALRSIKREGTTQSRGAGRDGRSEAHFPVVLQPVHLSAPNDRGFYSFRCPSLPGLRLPKIANYAELAAPVKQTVGALATFGGDNAVDLIASAYFTQAGRFDLRKPSSGFRWEEFLSHVRDAKDLYRPERLYLDSPFLVSLMRLVRSSAAVTA